MSEDKNKAVSALNTLIEYCKDGHHGYKTAAEDVKNPNLKSLFTNYSSQRGQFADQLKSEVTSLGATPDESGSITGAAHRTWIDIKSIVSSGDEKAILTECERGDNAAVKAYEDALKEELPLQASTVVRRQYSEIKSAYSKIHSLADENKPE